MAEKILEYENNFIANLNEKCKKEPLSKEEQKVLKELLVNTILYGNTKVDKDTLAIFIHKYVLSQELFSPSESGCGNPGNRLRFPDFQALSDRFPWKYLPLSLPGSARAPSAPR